MLQHAKMWITNSPVADIAVVWAKDEEGKIRGVIVEKDMPGFSAPEIKGKLSLRASITGELVFEDVRVPKENIFSGFDLRLAGTHRTAILGRMLIRIQPRRAPIARNPQRTIKKSASALAWLSGQIRRFPHRY